MLFRSEYNDRSKAMRDSEGKVITVPYSPTGICLTIQRYVEEGRCTYGDWFVLTRTNAQSEDMIRMLKKMGIPCDSFKKANLDNKGLKGKMRENTVKVLTIHTAKGLEAKNVIVIGAHYKDVEERCLCYVAATRAKDLLVWTISSKPRKTRKSPDIEYWGG